MSERHKMRGGSGVELLFHDRAPCETVPAAGQLAASEAAGFAAGAEAERQVHARMLSARDAEEQARFQHLAAQHEAQLAAIEARQQTLLFAIEAAFAAALLPLALEVARALLSTEPPAATVEALVAEAVAALPEAAAGVLRGPPAPGLLPPAGWRWCDDPAIAAGTVVAEVDATLVTASLGGRLAQLAQDLAR